MQSDATCRADGTVVNRPSTVPTALAQGFRHPGRGKALVQVLAVGVSAQGINALPDQPETQERSNLIAFPNRPGPDLIGWVVELGQGVSHPKIGARVICPSHLAEPAPGRSSVGGGADREGVVALADFRVLPVAALCDASASVLAGFGTGAMARAYGTAHNLLSRAEMRWNEKVLVIGAAGSEGLASVRLARLRGGRVTAQCPIEASDAVLAAGATTILPRPQMPEAASFDLVIDIAAGGSSADRLVALRPGGRYAAVGSASWALAEGARRRVHLNDLSLFGGISQSREIFAGLVTVIKAGAPSSMAESRLQRAEGQIAVQSETKSLSGKPTLAPIKIQ